MKGSLTTLLLLAVFPIVAQELAFKRNISKLYQSKSFAKTEQLLTEALKKSKQDGSKDYSIYYQLMLGENYQRQGLLPEAEKYFTNALDEVRALMPLTTKRYYLGATISQRTYFDAYDRLGFFYLSIGNSNKAEQLFNESKKLRDSYFDKSSVHLVIPLAGLGSVAFSRKEYDHAYRYYTQALALLKSATTTGYNYDNIYRIIYNDLVEISLISNRSDEVENYVKQLAKTSAGREQYGTKVAQNTETARIFDVFARNELLKGNFRKAQLYLDRAYDFLPSVETTGLIGFKLQLTQARLHWLSNNLELAATSFKSLVRNYQVYITTNFKLLTEYEREKFYYTLKHDIEVFNAFLLDCHNQDKAAQFGLYEVAYNNQLNLKALLLSSANARKSTILNSGDSQLINLYNLWEKTRAQLSASYFIKNSEADVADLTRKVEALDKELAQKVPITPNVSFDWQQVNANLAPSEYAVEIIRIAQLDPTQPEVEARDVTYMVLLNSAGSELSCITISKGRDLETRSARFYKNSILTRTVDTLSYNKYWLPLKDKLNQAKRIYLSPDGVFSQVNLNTLFNPVTKNYLHDEVELIYVTNTSDLLIYKSTQKSKTASLFGRPSYSVSLSNESSTGFRSLQNENLISLKDQIFDDLPGTEQEISVAQKILTTNGWQVKNFLADMATEKNLKSVNNPSLLHIATHGFFIADSTGTINPMIRSGLLFAGVSTAANADEDGILTAYEASLLNLKETHLVILSACETGMGEVRNGEGVYGLQRAIISAGAKNLLMSLWKVDDAATSELMSLFYQAWINQPDTGKAFRAAQQQVRKKYAHPFFWGAFIMLGN